LLAHWAPEAWYRGLRSGFQRAPFWLQGLLLLGVALILRRMASAEAVPFVYFQF
jgi:hypothetical protein